jgi:hypothetical protein
MSGFWYNAIRNLALILSLIAGEIIGYIIWRLINHYPLNITQFLYKSGPYIPMTIIVFYGILYPIWTRDRK